MVQPVSDEPRLVELISALSRSSDRKAKRALEQIAETESESVDPLEAVAEALVTLRHERSGQRP